jgi:CRISPR-associated protein Cas6
VDEGEAPYVDVVFELAGTSVPAEHAWPLWRALAHRLPWLLGEEGAGVHPLRVAPTGYGVALLARRARLALRVRRERVPDALTLAGATLDVAGSALVVGAGIERELRAWATLYARAVATGVVDEAAFQEDAVRRLAAMDIACECISGRRWAFVAGDREVVAFGLALHNVKPEDSLRVQCEGIGAERALGCGILVPHRSIAAVA